ncbi:solute carrier family 28 member 3-like [Mercenaria mercenaria]|uniref:solute carrier family 28 member 3-like n=1 Tax=Mercenaria mercenaria TaxID=6596 RepID=UPI00234E818A|nr:solute carrier family 28 member 3-like [Mercenaria mercenaria]
MKTYDITIEKPMKVCFNDSIKMHEQGKTDGKTKKYEINDDSNFSIHAENVKEFLRKYKLHFKTARNILLLVLYLGYYGYAMYCNFGDEPSIRLTVFTAFGVAYISWKNFQKLVCYRRTWGAFRKQLYSVYTDGRRPKITQWFFYTVWGILCVVYIIINVALKEARNLRPLAGIVVYILLLVLISNNRKRIHWHCVFYGIILQCLFGLFIIKTTAGTTTLLWFSDRLTEFMRYADVGSRYVFGEKYLDHSFVMQTIPAIIVFLAVIQVLMYLGAIQFVVKLIGTPMAYILDVSAPEAINACANIFLGGAEAGAIVLEYLFTMPTSRLFAINVGGLASCAGSALIQYMAFGVPIKYLLAASAMSAPAALVCAKLVYPDREEDALKENVQDISSVSTTNENGFNRHASNEFMKETLQRIPVENNSEKEGETVISDAIDDESENDQKEMKNEHSPNFKKPTSVGEALVFGTKNGIKLATSIIGLLIVSLAVLELLNKTVEWFGDRVNIHITFNLILSYLFYPFVYVMGVDTEDCLRAGEYLGLRTLSSPGIPYIKLGRLIQNRQHLTAYTKAFNESLEYDRASDIFLPNWNMTLTDGVFSERSELIVTYALCGYASIPTIGITFGLTTAFIPHRLPEISKLGPKILIAGTVASYLTACVAGLLS